MMASLLTIFVDILIGTTIETIVEDGVKKYGGEF